AAVSRVLNAFIKPDTVYPLYGFHDAAHRAIARIGNLKFFTYLFGDSAYIVHFLQWLGYRLSPVLQTGVNFGTEVRHANPSLSAPCFEIPRTVERDMRFDHLRTGEALLRGLAAKNRCDLQTIGVFLFTRWVGVFLFALLYLAALELYDVLPHAVNAMFFALSVVVTAVYLVGVQRCIIALRPVRPTICS